MSLEAVKRMERPSDEATREQVERILASPTFCGSKKLGQLFRFLVEQALAGGSFNEYSIAVDVFQRDESFDPAIDPVVRVHMLRLRTKLKEYQATGGTYDPIEIVIPPRTYLPTIRMRSRQSLIKVPDAARFQQNVAIRSFRCLSQEMSDRYFCDGLVEELIYALTKIKHLRVIPVYAIDGRPTSLSARELNEQFSVDTVLDGNVRKHVDTLRIAAHLTNAADGAVIRSEMCEWQPENALVDQQKVAGAIVHALFPRGDLLLAEGRPRTPGRSLDKVNSVREELFAVSGVREHA